MTPHDLTYGDLLARNAEVHGDALALVGAGTRLTHRQLYARCQALAATLAAHGVGGGDRVALLAPNRLDTVVLLGAVALRGAMLLLLNTRASAAEVAAIVEDAQPRLLVADASLQASLQQVPLGVPAVPGEAYGTLAAWLLSSAPDAAPVVPDATAAMPLMAVPTAAVEGRPRIALLSHRAMLHQSLQLAFTWSLGREDRHLGILPLFHVAGFGITMAVQLAGGATVLIERFDAGDAARYIAQERITCFATFAPILRGILDAAEAAGGSLASLRALSGLEAPETLAELARRSPGATFWAAYGQTETAGMVCMAPTTLCPGSAGRPLPGVALAIRGAQAPGESGEILVRGPCVFNGYWQLPAESAHAARDGWHHTGDLGMLDEQGFLRFQGRAPEKALIKTGGENVYPAEVEQVLVTHPAVAQAVVFGVPDERWGEAIRAICVVRDGHAIEAESLSEFVGTRIARFKRPRDVRFVSTLPLRADGSIDRSAVIHEYGD